MLITAQIRYLRGFGRMLFIFTMTSLIFMCFGGAARAFYKLVSPPRTAERHCRMKLYMNTPLYGVLANVRP